MSERHRRVPLALATVSAMDTARSVGSRWLLDRQVPDPVREAVLAEVSERLDSLPSPLHLAVAMVEGAMKVIPARLRPQVLRLPGIGEYGHFVEALTAVSFFDAVTATSGIPAPRSGTAAQAPARVEV